MVIPGDAEAIALWGLDNTDQFKGTRCTQAAALRGGNAGMKWALGAALDGGKDQTVQRQLEATVRSDQQLTQQVAAAIVVAWDRQLDHSARKARSRVARSTEGRRNGFDGWPNAQAAQIAGLDDLMDRAWDALVGSLTTIFAEYAKTQASLVAAVDEIGATSVRAAILARVPGIVNSLTAFLDQRARDFITGEVPFAPQDFNAGRTVSAWLSGSSGAPAGFTFAELTSGQFATALTTAQEAILAAAVIMPQRTFTWIHSFYGAPTVPFPPHEAIDGDTFTAAETETLDLFPGDHVGCRCEMVPDWSF